MDVAPHSNCLAVVAVVVAVAVATPIVCASKHRPAERHWNYSQQFNHIGLCKIPMLKLCLDKTQSPCSSRHEKIDWRASFVKTETK